MTENLYFQRSLECMSACHNFLCVFQTGLKPTTVECFVLKNPSQPPPFLMPSKLLILQGEAKTYCFTISCVPESTCMFNYMYL